MSEVRSLLTSRRLVVLVWLLFEELPCNFDEVERKIPTLQNAVGQFAMTHWFKLGAIASAIHATLCVLTHWSHWLKHLAAV